MMEQHIFKPRRIKNRVDALKKNFNNNTTINYTNKTITIKEGYGFNNFKYLFNKYYRDYTIIMKRDECISSLINTENVTYIIQYNNKCSFWEAFRRGYDKLRFSI